VGPVVGGAVDDDLVTGGEVAGGVIGAVDGAPVAARSASDAHPASPSGVAAP
jgi:hypothetical protein